MKKKVSLRVHRVEEKSLGEMKGISPGDRLITINGHSVHDIIDYQFYSSDEVLDCTFLRGKKQEQIHFQKEFGQNIGLEFESIRFKHCGNHCIFCFVDQNPKSVRRRLKFKDEDYRLSFLYGNYVTLTHIGKRDLERIVEQRLSPLYISIHATDLSIRKVLLGLKRNDHLLEKIEFLTKHRIELHGQIVLCQGINDSSVLDNSLRILSSFYPGLKSVAVVPVGLTKHRQRLPQLKGYYHASALKVVEQIEDFQKRFENELREPFVYLSDEFYLLSGEPLPSKDHYGEFWQIENGVGLTVSFLNTFDRNLKKVPKKLRVSKQFTWITGILAGPVLQRHVLPKLKRIQNLDVQIKILPNHFFGESVTVSGLLTGSDIIEAFRGDNDGTTLCLPPNCLNQDKVFLDDISLADLEKQLNRKVMVIQDIGELWKIM